MSIETREQFFRWAADHNIGNVVSFHNDMKRLMQNEIAWINNSLDDRNSRHHDTAALRHKKERYLGDFLYLLRQNTFLMLFSHLEEWLFHLRQSFAPTAKFDRSKGSLKRFGPTLSEGLGVDLSSPPWSFLCDCADVRDCLLHANGRVSLSNKADRIMQLVKRNNLDLSLAGDRLRLGGGLVLAFQQAIGELFDVAGCNSA